MTKTNTGSPARRYRDDFPSLAGFLNAICQAAESGDARDPRLEYRAAAIGAGGAFPSDGGFLMPVDHAAQLHERI